MKRIWDAGARLLSLAEALDTISPVIRLLIQIEVSGLPEAANTVHVKECFIRDENKIACQCLCDQHSIEGIAVQTRESSGPPAAVDRNHQLFEPLVSYAAGNVEHNIPCSLEFTETMFGGHLPSRRRADQYGVSFVCDRAPGSFRQPFAFRRATKGRRACRAEDAW